MTVNERSGFRQKIKGERILLILPRHVVLKEWLAVDRARSLKQC